MATNKGKKKAIYNLNPTGRGKPTFRLGKSGLSLPLTTRLKGRIPRQKEKT